MTALPAPTVTKEQIATRLNLKGDEPERVLTTAITTLERELQHAWREVPVELYDDWILRVAGAIVGSAKRPTGTTGQFTSADQTSPVPGPSRDYLVAVRGELAQYVPLGFA